MTQNRLNKSMLTIISRCAFDDHNAGKPSPSGRYTALHKERGILECIALAMAGTPLAPVTAQQIADYESSFGDRYELAPELAKG